MTDEDVFLDRDYVRFYEWSYQDYDSDIPFYMRMAEQCGSPILDVACGAGRVSIPLARAGYEVVGLDLSPEMLAIARARLAEEPPEVQQRVSLVEADMQGFDLGRQFAGVFVPNASVFHLKGRYSLARCFRCLYEHTTPGGLAVMDAVSPQKMAEQDIGRESMVREDVNPVSGLLTMELKQTTHMGWHSQVASVEHVFVEGDGDKENRFGFQQDYRWLERDEGMAFLDRAGFADITALGDFDGGEYTSESPRLILVARRLERDVR